MECTKLPFTARVGVYSMPFAFACTNRYSGGTVCKHCNAVSCRLRPSLAACSGKRAVKALQFLRKISGAMVKGMPVETALTKAEPAKAESVPADPTTPAKAESAFAEPIKAALLFKGEFNDHSFCNRRSRCRSLGSYIAVSGYFNCNIGSA